MARAAVAAGAIFVVSVDALANDVPFVPTPPEVVDAMLTIAGVTPADAVLDLGSGDGRIVIAAASTFGARATGVELDKALVQSSRERAKALGVEGRAQFRAEDLFETDLSGASVLTMYLLPQVNIRLREKIMSQMRPGSRVVSHNFHMGDWAPDRTMQIGAHLVYLWIVPARIEGSWTLIQSSRDGAGDRDEHLGDIVLRQSYQTVAGEVVADGSRWAIETGRIAGELVSFSFRTPWWPKEALRFEGRTSAGGDAIEGTLSNGRTARMMRTDAAPAAGRVAPPSSGTTLAPAHTGRSTTHG